MKQIFHIIGRTFDRRPFRIPYRQNWLSYQELFQKCYTHKTLEVHTFTQMPNHFHLLAATSLDIQDLEFEEKLDFTFEIISQEKAYRETYKYICLNPLRAKLCQSPEQYPYSTLHHQFYQKPLPYPLFSRIPIGLGGIERELLWIKASCHAK